MQKDTYLLSAFLIKNDQDVIYPTPPYKTG